MIFWHLFGTLGFHMKFWDLFRSRGIVWDPGISQSWEFIWNFWIYMVICDLFGILEIQMGFWDWF